MTLHPQAITFLARLRAEGARPAHELTVAQARQQAEGAATGTREPVAAVTDLRIPGPAAPVPVRVYSPSTPARGVVVYLHGGGHISGSVAGYDGLNRRLANRVPATVVAVDYRRAPEHRCPAAVDDAEAVYHWVVARAGELAPQSEGRVAIAGDSAGGNNAAVLARRLRDAGAPPPALQVLIYPPLDAVAYRDPDAYRSYRQCGRGFGLVYEDGLYYWDHYLGPHGDPTSPDASPLRAASLAGLCPAYVLTVEYDVLRDEGDDYAARLRDAGVTVRHRRWDGHLHGFLGSPDTFDDAEPALDDIAAALGDALLTS